MAGARRYSAAAVCSRSAPGAYLATAIIALTTRDVQLVTAAYELLWRLGWYVLVPVSLAATVVGLLQSLVTPWGVMRHFWVLAKLGLTVAGALVLLEHMDAVGHVAELAAGSRLSVDDHRTARVSLVIHPAGGVLLLLAATILSVYKPWGLTPYGQRLSRPRSVPARHEAGRGAEVGPVPAAPRRQPTWVYIVGVHAIALAVLVAVAHLMRGS